MRRRCREPNSANYARYGGRGISVCKRWDESFEAFLQDMGEAPAGMSIEREDNDGNYEPANCSWATLETQNNNRRSNVIVEFNGRSQTLKQWARELGINYRTLHTRYRNGRRGAELLSTTQLPYPDQRKARSSS
ncbi:hypothetical protein [Aureimonas sp. AU40]|uniref:hypothetical protein n=1 Tax=Aureimonas sp. AU40 TaxID=1637747 RepID=UPI000780D92C|nr:hypothetical protein [Aureimonas sp. AU40]